MDSELRAYTIIVDCLNDDDDEQFYKKYGFMALGNFSGCKKMFIPMKTVGEFYSNKRTKKECCIIRGSTLFYYLQ